MAATLDNEQLIEQLRRAAATWFKNSDLLLLEEFIRRFTRLSAGLPPTKEKPRE